MDAAPASLVSRFQVEGTCESVERFEAGHINDSFVVTCRAATTRRHYFLQRVNRDVFSDVAALVENVRRIAEHIGRIVRGKDERAMRFPSLIPARDGAGSVADSRGGVWRLFTFVENTRTYLTIDSPARAFAAARAYGEFQMRLIDLPPPPLNETIRDFHNTPLRLRALQEVVARDPAGRAAAARWEIDFARRHAALGDIIVDLQRRDRIPDRVVHYDAKISNVLFDADSDEAVCVVDFDTVMPGSVLYDFGDMVRSMTCPADEDEVDLARVRVDLELFAAVARGYLASAGGFLTDVERQHLVAAAQVITYEQGVRFLSDFLAGDVYYKTARPEHNLDRARNQFRLVESLIKHETAMNTVVATRA